MKLDKRWKIKYANVADVDNLHEALKVNPALCRVLAVRDIKDYDSAKLFFRPELSHLHDPYLMLGMDKAVTRITAAILVATRSRY